MRTEIDPRKCVAFDCETHLIQPGLLAPPMVCLSWATELEGDRVSQLLHRNKRDVVMSFLGYVFDSEIVVGANTAYDVGVVLAYAESLELTECVFRAYEEDRVFDVQINDRLADIARGRLGGSTNHRGEYSRRGYSLADLAQRHLKKDRHIQKSDPHGWRLRYAELHDVELDQWPNEAREYAIEDAVDTHAILLEQLKDPAWQPDAAAQARADLALHLLSCWGIMTDEIAIQALEAATVERFHALTRELQAEGLIRSNETRDTKKATRRIVEVYRANGVPVPLTDGGTKLVVELCNAQLGKQSKYARDEDVALIDPAKIREIEDNYASLDAEACEGSGDPMLMKYAERTSLQTIVKTHIPDLRNGLVTPIQARWGIAETGRVTCQKGRGGSQNGFQLTNPARAIMMPCPACEGPDTAVCSRCKGKGEIVGPGVRECFRARDGYVFVDADFTGLELCTIAQVCKTILGWSDLGTAINAGKDVHLDLGAQLLGVSYEHAHANKRDKEIEYARQLAKVGNFGFPGGLGARGFVAYARGFGMPISMDAAKQLRTVWLTRWSEMQSYFNYVRDLCEDMGTADIVQLGSYRRRGFVPYTAACNSMFQGLGADVAKRALWAVTRACYADRNSVLYGSHVVNFVHDQLIVEVPIERAHSCAMEVGRLMTEHGNTLLPDVPTSVEPCLSFAWHKNAKAVYKFGVLIAWDWAKENWVECQYGDGTEVRW